MCRNDRHDAESCSHEKTQDVTANIGGGESIILTTLCLECGRDV
jgi:hypothetical protein